MQGKEEMWTEQGNLINVTPRHPFLTRRVSSNSVAPVPALLKLSWVTRVSSPAVHSYKMYPSLKS